MNMKTLIFFLTHAPYDYWKLSDEPNLDEDNNHNADTDDNPEDEE